MQALHECEAAEHVDAGVSRQSADRLDHRERLVLLRRRQHGRRILEVHQDDVGLRFVAQLDQSIADGRDGFVKRRRRRIQVRALPDGIRADLPDHQIGLLGDDVGIESLKLDRRFLAADSLVDQGDPGVRIFGLKQRQQPLRIGLDLTFTGRGRRADRDNLGPSSGEALRKVGQAILERDRLNRDPRGIAVHGSPVCCSRNNVEWNNNSAPERDRLDRARAPITRAAAMALAAGLSTADLGTTTLTPRASSVKK